MGMTYLKGKQKRKRIEVQRMTHWRLQQQPAPLFKPISLTRRALCYNIELFATQIEQTSHPGYGKLKNLKDIKNLIVLDELTTQDLRFILSSKHLSTTGERPDLIARISDYYGKIWMNFL